MSLPGDENPNPQWQQPPQSQWQREPQSQWQQQPTPSVPLPGWVAPPRTPGQAYASLIFGILGLFPLCPIVLSVVALILGFTAKNQIDRSGGQLAGAGIALAGIIIGGIGLAFYGVLVLVVLGVSR
jgi:hypothetical protein